MFSYRALRRAHFKSNALIAIGGVLILFAALVSNGGIERALIADPSHTLSWGPALFRALLFIHGAALVFAGVNRRRTGRDHHVNQGPKAAHPSNQHKGAMPWLVLGGLSVLGLGLRLWHLNSGLWFDEVLTLLDFVRPPLGQIVTTFPSQNQHMLYSVLAHVSVSLFGESAWALRLPSVVFGVASIWALFLLGRRVSGSLIALLACALMTVSYHHIWFSQNARGYMGLMFFSLLATWLWLEAMERDEWRWWISYAAALALGTWIHLTMAFVAGSHGLLLLLTLMRRKTAQGESERRDAKGGSWWKPLAAYLLFGTLVLQFYALALPEFLARALHEESLQSEWTNPIWVITESVRSLRIGFSGLAVVLAAATITFVGWLAILRKERIAGLAMVLPAVLAGSAMLLLGHNLWPRFFFFSMGFGLLIVVHGAMDLPKLLLTGIKPLERWRPFGQRAGVATACLLILASVLTVPRCYALPKQDFAGARDFVELNRREGDAVVAVGLAGRAYGSYFAREWLVAQTQQELDAIRRRHSDTWLVYTIPVQVRAYCPGIWQEVERDFRVVRIFAGTLGGGEVYVCQLKSPSGGQS